MRGTVATQEQVASDLAAHVAAGAWRAGDRLPGLRALAETHGASVTTVSRALQELAGAGVVEVAPRRRAVVTPDGARRASRWGSGLTPLRLAGSDDPGLSRVLAAGLPIVRGGVSGSHGGLRALWNDEVDAAALHLRTPDGDYNGPFVARLLRGREPVIVHLWARQQGIVVAPDRAEELRSLRDLVGRRVALRAPGTGTRALLEQRARAEHLDPAGFVGPTVDSHLDVAVTVATGTVDAGIAVQAVAELFGLAFHPLTWEPFELAVPRAQLPQLDPLLEHVTASPSRREFEDLGYDLARVGEVRGVAA